MTDNPADDANVRGDPFKTLIVARLSYDANESDLEKEFGRFGPIERVSATHPSCSHFTLLHSTIVLSCLVLSGKESSANLASDSHHQRHACTRAT